MSLEDSCDGVVRYLTETCCFVPDDAENLKGSGERMARAIKDICLPADRIAQIVKECLEVRFPYQTLRSRAPYGSSQHAEQPVMIGPIDAVSLCPHHILPIQAKVWVSYVPSSTAIGLSKVVRIVQALAARPVIQEQFAADVQNAFMTAQYLTTRVAVHVEASHGCMTCRGVRSSARTSTECMSVDFAGSAALVSAFRDFVARG